MSVNIIPCDRFKREVKRLFKKFPSSREDLLQLNIALTDTPEAGTPLGNNIYKIRLAVKSKGKGKRGGARVLFRRVDRG